MLIRRIRTGFTMNTTSKTITLVTGNEGKLKEMQAILGTDFPHEIVTNSTDLSEYQGDADTVSRLKCMSAYEQLKCPVLVEDTSLGFNAMDGLPGPYIKWFLKAIGPEGLHKMLHGFEDKTANAQATLAYFDGERGSDVVLFKGITKGTIVSPRGECGFGWDSCFQPENYNITYAQMSFEEKNVISHRKKAVEAMRDYFVKKS